jgi:hypothetical protein
MLEQASNAESNKKHFGGAGGGGGGTASPIFSGVVLDGMIFGATVTDLVTGTSVITNANGEFKFNYIPDGGLQSSGGTDAITGLQYKGTLQAPFGATVISPISHVVKMMMDTGVSENAAKLSLSEYSESQGPRQKFDDITLSRLMNIHYINEAVYDNKDYAFLVQSLANDLEILAEISASIVVSPEVSGNIEDLNYLTKYNSAKETCWINISNRIKDGLEIEPSEIINASTSDPSIHQTMIDAANNVRRSCSESSRDLTYNAALNINYRTTSMGAINKSAKEIANSLVTTWALPEHIKSDPESVMEHIQGEFEQVRERIDENKLTLNKVKKDTDNVIVESYSGYGIEERSINYVNEPIVDDIISCREENRIYAKSFDIGYNVWSTTEVLKIDGGGIFEIGYRYKWWTSDAQEHKFVYNDTVYTISSIIGVNVDVREKEKQAYISKIQTLDSYMIEVGAVHIKIPRPRKIKLEDPRKGPGEIVNPGKFISVDNDLINKELVEVDPPEAPIVVEAAEILGAVRTEEKIFENIEDGIEIKEVIETKDGEKVKEELIIEVDEKLLKSEIDNAKVKDEKNIDEVGEKLIHPADKEFKEEGGTEKSIAVRSKAEENFLEAE